jgi:RNA polymerase sigma-70 factor (ECF subfamily)
MSDSPSFVDFLTRIRAGDEQAAVELVRRYEPLIRREIRLHIDDQRLNRIFDSMDICQSVMASFFVRTAAGAHDLEEPNQLLRLLVTMARNKLASAARKQYRHKRDSRRSTPDDAAVERAAASEPTPSEQVAGRELLREFRARLTDEERQIADLRADDVAWADIAAKMGGAPQGRRMQLVRAIERIERELGLEDADD